jgi:hypothetical protein
VRRLAALTAVALVAVPVGAASAAEPPERTAWWSAASGGGLAVPQPSTEEGDLRVTRAVDTQAFAAVHYVTDEDAFSATLVLALREGRTVGMPDVVACPTVGTDWPAGGNQPLENAPDVDCNAGISFGTVSEDATSITFTLDVTQQAEPGVWSMALVPQPEGTVPFSIDFVAPDASAFQADGGASFGLPAPPPAPADDSASTSTGGDTGTTTGSGSAALSSGFLGASPPAGSFDTSPMPPLVADSGAAAESIGSVNDPVVAGAQPATQPQTARRVAADPASGWDSARLAALLGLVALAALIGRASGQTPPPLRLLGGRARVVALDLSTAAVTAGTAAAVPLAGERARGIGRFARPRDAAPRRLR